MMVQPQQLGFVGLGIMGMPMASNIISKSPSGSTLYIYDIYSDIMRKFALVHGRCVVVCESPKEVSTKAVCHVY